MKRKSFGTGLSTYTNLSKIYPIFFWKKCSKCKKEFRRERGWSVITPPYYRCAGTWRYLCGSCAPTEEEASNYFKYCKWKLNRPSKPPAPCPQSDNGPRKNNKKLDK